jgi:cytochrome c peroxidase
MKIKNLLKVAGAMFCLALAVIACSKNDSYSNVNRYTLDVSGDYNYDFASTELATLGRVLFYDQSLSINNSTSCGSCHKQALAFSDDKQFSDGFERKKTDRNTPPIQNLGAFNTITFPSPGNQAGQALFWDGRERLLSSMVMQPMFNHVEMGMRSPTEVVNRVKNKSYYPELFQEAFGDNEINIDRVSQALSSFVMSMTAFNTGLDRRLSNGVNNFSDAQQRGLDLFFGKYNCGSCHQPFSSSGYFPTEHEEELINIGLDVNYTDNGMGDRTGNAEDNGRFKIPNLRNVALTAPYMHDGRFQTLEEVLNHYSSGVKQHPNLDDRLKDANGMPMILHITEQEKRDMIEFLKTMTDNDFITDPKFSNPFRQQS